MKVLFVDGARTWTDEQDQLRLLMRHLAQQGVEVACVCPETAPLALRLTREQLRVQPIRWPEGGGWGLQKMLRRLAAGHDVVHARGETALRALRWCNRPIVATRLTAQPVQIRVWRRAARVLVASDTVRAMLVAAGLDESRVRVVRPGIDRAELAALDRPSPGLRDRIGVPESAFLVGAAAPLVDEERQTLIPRTAARLRDVHWVIIGDGPARTAIQAAITAHGVGLTVHLPGALPEPRRFLGELDVFVSAAAADPAGAALLAPLALGVPVIAADDAAAAELLAPVHVATGATLFPPGDPDALARLIARLEQDEALADRLEREGLRRVEELTIERTAALTLGVYRELTA